MTKRQKDKQYNDKKTNNTMTKRQKNKQYNDKKTKRQKDK